MTIDYKALIKSIEKLFYEPVKIQSFRYHNIWQLKTEGVYEAVNRINYMPEPVKVAHWFGDFWIFLEMRFTIDKGMQAQIISIKSMTNSKL
jgi:hypothetical protein